MVDKDLKGENSITTEHIVNNLAIRKILHHRGVKPEQLPPAEDVKKVIRKLDRDEQKLLKEVTKIQDGKPKKKQ